MLKGRDIHRVQQGQNSPAVDGVSSKTWRESLGTHGSDEKSKSNGQLSENVEITVKNEC